MTAEELRAALIGTWRLVSYEATSVRTGEIVRPYGDAPDGLIVYTPGGHVSVQVMRSDRTPFAGSALDEGRPEELAAAALGYIAYAGPFHVPDGQTVVHDVAVSLFPNWVSGAQRRTASVDGRTLRLGPAGRGVIGATRRDDVLTWERI
ncbi:hypothetical protein Pth03_54680 [Planotetraspora thailandica]|uniref:Lipocalin-like domain-containing protein n=1 Tax=Planotetraspora thailandica TaxID=487172 RepID=A0A8J3XXU4_9ACTN|nr:lipocalin-like domain-containing protein [Planotetraspora thailandica]GII57079.1 hypothetical protein Pth03_54680 [Planotetraspora thailandica]